MKQRSSLEQEYKNLMNQTTPDLWSRIEGNLKEHPERVSYQEKEAATETKDRRISYRTRPAWTIFGPAAAAAAVFLVLMASPWHPSLFPAEKNTVTGGGMSDDFDPAIAAETTAEIMEYANLEKGEEIKEYANLEKGEEIKEYADLEKGEETVKYADLDEKVESSRENSSREESSGENSSRENSSRENSSREDSRMSDSKAAAGILRYSQLNLMSYSSLTLPEQAVTLPEDTMYFSEDILEDTELLCLGTVTSISVETEPSRHAAFLVYDISLEDICYSADYTTGLEHITVKSPVVGAEGGENQILYQLQAGASYLLPLKKQAETWELVFPFAPQIQAAGDGAYLFHSGYASLTNANTFVVIGEQEGANDFYYDRMLLREDEDFLSDYIALVMKYTGGAL